MRAGGESGMGHVAEAWPGNAPEDAGSAARAMMGVPAKGAITGGRGKSQGERGGSGRVIGRSDNL